MYTAEGIFHILAYLMVVSVIGLNFCIIGFFKDDK